MRQTAIELLLLLPVRSKIAELMCSVITSADSAVAPPPPPLPLQVEASLVKVVYVPKVDLTDDGSCS